MTELSERLYEGPAYINVCVYPCLVWLYESDTMRCMSLNVLRLYFVCVMFETHVVL